MGLLAWSRSLRSKRFQRAWDRYATRANRNSQWPGDEWGRPDLWSAWFERLFRPAQVQSWARAVEIGQGTGKYTRLVLEAGKCEVMACDVSRAFLDLCNQRQSEFVQSRRLHLTHIEENNPVAIQDACRARDWLGNTDALYSIDAFVHLPFTQIAAYMLAGTDVLRVGGHLIFSFADGTSEAGHRKLIGETDKTIAKSCDPSTACFHWASPQMVRSFAERIGYEVLLCDVDPHDKRDGHFVARYTDPAAAAAARAMRNPVVK